MQYSRPGGTPGPRSPVALPCGGKSSIRKGGESLVWGPTWLEIKTVKFFEPGEALDKVETYPLSQYPALVPVLKEVRQGAQGLKVPELGTPFDGCAIRRCPQTIDKGIYLVVLEEDGQMFFVEDDLQALPPLA
ncbi:hypothetical protein [Carboxydocella thermautotrophica]|uniref:hypothetical protein n=1 Tax=Carboxydocella thermautotrophica TaxID=178899 RepID=UPI000D314B97|nr:hypothetical protein [Carboxydocella thermautotrophica]